MPSQIGTWRMRREYFGSLLVDMSGLGRITWLNPVATDILDLIMTFGMDEKRIAQTLASIYDGVSADSLQADVSTLISNMEKMGSIIRANVPELVGRDISLDAACDYLKTQHESVKDPILSAPFEINVYPTLRCNIDCNFCYLSRSMRSTYGPSKPDILPFLKWFDECKQEGVFGVNFLGGEPFLFPELIENTLENFGQDFLINVTTNGTMGRKVSPRLFNLLSSNGGDIVLSLHSASSKIHDSIVGKVGSYDKALEFLQAAIAAGVRIAVQMVFTKHNTTEDATRLFDLTLSSGAAGFYVNIPFVPSYMSLEDYSKIRPSIKEVELLSKFMNSKRAEFGDQFFVYLKGAYSFAYFSNFDIGPPESPMDRWLLHPGDGGTSLEVMSDGKIQLGSLFFEGDIDGIVGNISRDTLHDVWRSPAVQKWRQRPEVDLQQPCCNCEYQNYCNGGNFIQSQMLFDDASIGDVRCPRVWSHVWGESMEIENYVS